MMVSRAVEVLTRIEKDARRKGYPIIGPRKGRLLVEAIHEKSPEHVLEIGCLVGYSAILMGNELEEGSLITTIEKNPVMVEISRQNIQEAGFDSVITVMEGDALNILPRLPGEYDFMFIDAAKHQYYQYLTLAESMLKDGAVVFADNVGWSHYAMEDYLDYVRGSGKFVSRYIPVGGDGVEISVKASNNLSS